jgi:hypothetical protein
MSKDGTTIGTAHGCSGDKGRRFVRFNASLQFVWHCARF